MKFFLKKTIVAAALSVSLFVLFACAQAAFAQLVTVDANDAASLGLSTQTDVRATVLKVVRYVLGFVGLAAVVIVIYGGVVWQTAAGNEERVARAKTILRNGLVGVLAVMFSFSIVTFVGNALGIVGGTGGTTVVGPTCQQLAQPGQFCCSGASGTPSNFPCSVVGGSSFRIVNLSPQNGAAGVVRNAVVMVRFSAPVNPSSVVAGAVTVGAEKSIPIVGGGFNSVIQPVPGTLSVDASDPSLVKFVPSGSCAPVPNQPSVCLPENAKIKVQVTVQNGIVSSDNKALSCGTVGCAASFVTGTLVDTQPPTAAVIKHQYNEALLEGQYNSLVQGTDDAGLADVSYSFNGVDYFTAPEASVVQSKETVAPFTVATYQWPYDTTGMALGTQSLFVRIRDFANNAAIAAQPFRLFPPHCTNGDRDADETGVDCGGSCGACNGGACNVAAQCLIPAGHANKCNPFASCDPKSCSCVAIPVITYVDTAFFAPDGKPLLVGAVGNFITVTGKNFGSVPGKVYVGAAELIPPQACGNYWSDSEIVVQLPAGSLAGPIKVQTAGGATDLSDDENGPAIGTFASDQSRKAPGLCSVCALDANGKCTLKSGIAGQTPLEFLGSNLGDKQAGNAAIFGGQAINQSIPDASWNPDNITGVQTPNVAAGITSVSVRVAGIESNRVNFTVTAEEGSKQPLIQSISPAAAAPGSYVTIKGKGFGASRGTKAVKFVPNGNFALAGIADNASYDGGFDFPEQCGGGTWTDTQIVVKVPAYLDAPAKKAGISLWTASTGGTRLSNSFGNAANPSDPTQPLFAGASGAPAPGLCLVVPSIVRQDTATAITAYGDNLGTAGSVEAPGQGTLTASVTGKQISFSTLAYNEGNPSTLLRTGLVSYARADGAKSNGITVTAVDATTVPEPGKVFLQVRFKTKNDPANVIAREHGCEQGRTGPTPAAGTTGCINGVAGASFKYSDAVATPPDLIDAEAAASADKLPRALDVYRCGTGDSIVADECERLDFSGTSYFDYYGVSKTASWDGTAGLAGSVSIIPIAKSGAAWVPAKWDANTWYKVSFKGADGGLVDREYGVRLPSAYEYSFKTGTQECDVDDIFFDRSKVELLTGEVGRSEIRYVGPSCQTLVPASGATVTAASSNVAAMSVLAVSDDASFAAGTGAFGGGASASCSPSASLACQRSFVQAKTPAIGVKHTVNYVSPNRNVFGTQTVDIVPAPFLVVEQSGCTERKTASPSPAPGSSDACRNAVLFVRFTQPVEASTITGSSVVVTKKIGSASSVTCPIVSDSSSKNASCAFVAKITDSILTLTPHSTVDLEPGAQYSVSLDSAIRSALPEHSPLQGVLKSGSAAYAMPYSYSFSVNEGVCSVKSVSLESGPQALGMGNGDQFGKEYLAVARGQHCVALNPEGIAWTFGKKNDGGVLSVYPGTGAAANTVRVTAHSVSDVSPYKNPSSFAGLVTVSATDASTKEGISAGAQMSVPLFAPFISSVSPDNGSARENLPTAVTLSGARLGDGTDATAYFKHVSGAVLNGGGAIVPGTEIEAVNFCSNWSDATAVIGTPVLGNDAADPYVTYSPGPKGIPTDTEIPLKTGIFVRRQPSAAATLSDSNVVTFTPNKVTRPALCRLEPSVGTPGEKVTVQGKNFGDDAGSLPNPDDVIPVTNATKGGGAGLKSAL